MKRILLCVISVASLGMQAKNAENIIKELQAGNTNFMNAQQFCFNLDNRKDLALGQAPDVIIVGCSDSRVPPEIVMGRNNKALGGKFVVRTAGNLCSEGTALGSVEFAHGVLKANVIVVLGHSECGAVKAAIAYEKGRRAGKGERQQSAHIQQIIDEITPSFAELSDLELNDLNKAIAANTQHVAQRLRAHFGGSVSVYAAVYQLDTGKVDFLNN